MSKTSQWLTEQHYLVCPKGVMFKQMKVTSQRQVRFSGHLAATSADTMIGNAFMCMGNLAIAAPPVSALQSKAVAVMASPGLGLPRIGIPPQLLAFASSIGTMKCNLSAVSRTWVNSSTKLRIQGHSALVVGESTMLCPAEAAVIEAKDTFWEAVSTRSRNSLGHIALFNFGLLASRGLGTLTAASGSERPLHDPSSLSGNMSLLSRMATGASVYQMPTATRGDTERPLQQDQLLASGVELNLALFAAKGETLTCFPAGTLVHTNNGLLPIEQINEGRLVWTRNEQTLERELKPVTVTFKRAALKMVMVELDMGIIFELTADHECYSDGSWRSAQELSAGDHLENIIGNRARIKHLEMFQRSTLVYNLAIKDNENYFVTAEGLLVHNATY